MRKFNNQPSAATRAKIIPFQGLGFAMDQVIEAAQAMTPVPHSHVDCSGVTLTVPDIAKQPSGYFLLVTLGREIRGR